MKQVRFRVQPSVSDESLNDLFASAWGNHEPRTFQPVLRRSLTYICAFDNAKLVGFVNVAWDGGLHGFILDVTVDRQYQRQGIGTELVKRAAAVSRDRGLEWLHVDFEARLAPFYRGCGFGPSEAGILNLRNGPT